jgi:oligopeptide transport system substrate-binding protein
MKKKLLSALLVVAMLATTVVGCGFTGTPEEAPAATEETADGETAAPAKKSVTLSQLSDPIKYDPRDMVGNDMQMIGIQQYVGLIKANANGELEPACAESWEVSDDFTVYTFKINENVKWSDGKNVTAHDFVYAWTTALNPEFASEAADQYYDIKNAQAYNTGKATVEEVGVKALDDYTLEVTMEYPNGLFEEKVASVKMAPVRQDIVEMYDDPRELAITPDTLVVNGPYKMTSYQSKNQIVLTKNENYYNADKVAIDEVVVKFIEEATTSLASFKTGEVDICSNIPTAEVPGMIADGTALARPMLATYYYSLNMDPETQDPAVYEALSKLEVRQALSLAIDRTLITEKVVQGGQTPSKGFVPAGITMPDGSDWTDASNYEFIQPTADPERAKELLAAAGYPNGEGFPVMEIFYNTSESHQAIAQVVQDMWKQTLGITVELVNK